MQITYSYPSGRRVVAVVLAVGANFIRVVEPGQDDGSDIYLRDQEWVTEAGEAVRVDSILLGDRTRFPTKMAAGRRSSRAGKVRPAVAGGSGS